MTVEHQRDRPNRWVSDGYGKYHKEFIRGEWPKHLPMLPPTQSGPPEERVPTYYKDSLDSDDLEPVYWDHDNKVLVNAQYSPNTVEPNPRGAVFHKGRPFESEDGNDRQFSCRARKIVPIAILKELDLPDRNRDPRRTSSACSSNWQYGRAIGIAKVPDTVTGG